MIGGGTGEIMRHIIQREVYRGEIEVSERNDVD